MEKYYEKKYKKIQNYGFIEGVKNVTFKFYLYHDLHNWENFSIDWQLPELS